MRRFYFFTVLCVVVAVHCQVIYDAIDIVFKCMNLRWVFMTVCIFLSEYWYFVSIEHLYVDFGKQYTFCFLWMRPPLTPGWIKYT